MILSVNAEYFRKRSCLIHCLDGASTISQIYSDEKYCVIEL